MVTERVTGRPCFLVEHWLFTQPWGESAVSTLPASAVSRNERTEFLAWVSTLLGPEEAAAVKRAFSNGPAEQPPGWEA